MAFHVLIVALVTIMLMLANWQWDRHQQRIAFNNTLIERVDTPTQPLEQVLVEFPNASDAEWRSVVVTGLYLQDHDIQIVNVSQGGGPGFDPVTPLQLSDGRLILVNRGFVPLVLSAPAAPSGRIEIVGYLRASQSRSALGPIDSTDASNTEFQRFDVPLIAAHVGRTIEPMFLQLIQETPAPTSPWPAKVPLPPLDEGTHLSYAMQWFFFCLVAITAWVVVVRRKILQVNASVQAQTSA